jgi:hypothetical protein
MIKQKMTAEEILDTLNKLNFNNFLRLPNHQKTGNVEFWYICVCIYMYMYQTTCTNNKIIFLVISLWNTNVKLMDSL